jgi:hypothetical protein
VGGPVARAVAEAVSAFGAAVEPRFAHPVGEPEDQMRGPLENLLARVAAAVGVRFHMIGETSLADLRVRPDYAVFVNDAITGYIEVKAPGKGADPTRWAKRGHDGKQWAKLSALPNVLYTDGECWGLYHTGERVGEVIRLNGDVTRAGASLTVDGDGLARVLTAFLSWKPIAPRSVAQLVHAVAPLTRLLRDEVTDTMAREAADGGGPFTALATDWRALLFPDASDREFADGYAQSVTFALLLARTENIDFTNKNVEQIAAELGRSHSLLGKALSVLTDTSIGALTVTLSTLVRVISVVDFSRFAHHIADPYLALYENFLAEYDEELRKKTGSYYTPAAVVTAMTRLVDQALRERMGRPLGLAADGVTVVDPAMGTGAFVLKVLEHIATTIEREEGEGAVPARMTEAAKRIAGIEKQTGPFAVAELRVSEALDRHQARAPRDGLRLFLADSLEDPFIEHTTLGAMYEPIAVSRRRANRIKKDDPVLVFLGNPPYRERAKGHGGFIETGSTGTNWATPLLDAFREPSNGQAEYVLSNLYVYFWRLATWKVFDAHPPHPDGVICFITTAGYLKGPGFAGMRRYLRTHATEGWIIDGTPEGHQPDVSTRIFGGVQQPVAIGLFIKHADNDLATPATIKYTALHGRQADKFAQLQTLELDGDQWEDCPTDWTAPFLPTGGDLWDASPALGDLLPWVNQGVVGGRTWVYAPLSSTLVSRWDTLIAASAQDKGALLVESRDVTLTRTKRGLHGHPHGESVLRDERGSCLTPVKVAYRSFDIQYLIPDDRVISTPRTALWITRGERQIYTTEQHDQPGKSGPGLTFAAEIPDMHHYNGRGGRVLPLYMHGDGSDPNLAPGLLDLLSDRLGVEAVAPEDLLAYIAAVTAHPAFTERFAEDLRTPGVRVPLTAHTGLWDQAVQLGNRVLWLHTRGTRCTDPAQDRPPGPPKVTDPGRRPKVHTPIPDDPSNYPNELTYDPDTETLHVGTGTISPVTQAVIDYQVSGMNVLRKWFGYRRATKPPASRGASPLDDIRPSSWPPAYTTDLLEVLNVLTLVVDLEPQQAQLLDQIVDGPLITIADLTEAGVLPVPPTARRGPMAIAAPEQAELL